MGSFKKNYSCAERYLEHAQVKTHSQQWMQDYTIVDYHESVVLASGRYLNLGARGKDFQKLMFSKKEKEL